MKKYLFIIAFIFLAGSFTAEAGWTNKTMVFGGLTRSYRVYQSPNYNASVPASLIIALHGLGDNMNNFSGIGLNYIADTANIICIFPQAVSDIYAGTAWNSGAGAYGYYPNQSVNDIGFINALIDTAIAKYAIDITRVYLCGFSMGGFMTERMAIQSNGRIAAFGSMSGTIGSGISNPVPGRHVPIAHFHGTADSTVAYTGNLYGMDAEDLVAFWVANNGCDTTPVHYNYPDLVNDNITAERFEYSNGDPQSDVWFFKMTNMGHTVLYQPTNDMTEILELWLFLRRHSLATAGTVSNTTDETPVQVFPNPVSSFLSVVVPEGRTGDQLLTLYNMQGAVVKSQSLSESVSMIDLTDPRISNGIYMLKITGKSSNFTQKVLIRK